MTSVTVLGGGVGGLSAAHELAERGFSVSVVERNERFGGKARSFPGPTVGDAAVPAEHGFRFFPGFYRHVTDTMGRIPYRDGNVRDNLVETTEIMEATTSRRWVVPTRPGTRREHEHTLWSVLGGPDVPRDEKVFFLERLLHLLSSCDQRWREQYEHVDWWEFVKAERMSPAYRKILGRGISQLLVAMRPEVASTRTMGRVYLQLVQGLFDDSMEADYVLNGPTNDVWIDPWVEYLDGLGVELRPETTVRAVESDGERVTGVRVAAGGVERTLEADYYVAALPVKAMERLTTPELTRAAPSLGGLSKLRTAWMNGIQFYLDRDLSLAAGHGIYYDSPWALTTISQRQFWASPAASRLGDEVEDVLSVCISDWDRPGVLYDRPARECSPEEIRAEVWAQLQRHLNTADGARLPDESLIDWHLDPAVEYDERTGRAHSREPLLINTVGSLQHRPPAATAAENLVLASDYVRTHTDLACMEGANEAARRAVNAVVERSGVDATPCRVDDLSFPPQFDRLRRVDAALYRGNLSHPGSVTPRVWDVYSRVRRQSH